MLEADAGFVLGRICRYYYFIYCICIVFAGTTVICWRLYAIRENLTGNQMTRAV